MSWLSRAFAKTLSKLLRPQFSPPLWREFASVDPARVGPAFQVIQDSLRDQVTFDALLGRLGDTAQAKILASLGVNKCRDLADCDRAELPPPELRERYHGSDHAAYWLSGLGDAELVRSVVARRGAAPLRILDLGCSSGRLLRHFRDPADVDCYGCDINADSVAWMRQHLPHVVAFTSTILPTLPLPSARFDAVCALSVFTHIDEFEEAWLLEISRILQPGGVAVVSIHSSRTWSEMLTRNRYLGSHLTKPGQCIDSRQVTESDFAKAMPSTRVVVTDTRSAVYNTNVFHHLDYVRSRWSRFFGEMQIMERAHGEHQDLVIMKRSS
jgi:ubiquinone/menaquinone biosynthesis C-methylase UbiE